MNLEEYKKIKPELTKAYSKMRKGQYYDKVLYKFLNKYELSLEEYYKLDKQIGVK